MPSVPSASRFDDVIQRLDTDDESTRKLINSEGMCDGDVAV